MPRCTAPWRELRGDFRRREIGDLDAVKAGDGAAIVARAARLDEFEPGAREKGLGVFLQAAFRRHRKDEGGAHAAPPQADKLLDRGGKSDRRDRLARAEPRQQAVVAAAGDERTLGARVMQLEHEAGVVIEAAAERRGEMDRAHVDAARGKKAGARLEQIERRRKRELGVGGERAQFAGGFVRIAAHGEEALDQRAGLARQPRSGAKRGLFEKALGDLGDGTAADRGDAGDGEKIGDEMMRRLGIGAGERGEHALIFRRTVAWRSSAS